MEDCGKTAVVVLDGNVIRCSEHAEQELANLRDFHARLVKAFNG